MADLVHLEVKKLEFYSALCINISRTFNLNLTCARNMLGIHSTAVSNDHDSLAEMVH